MDSSISIAVSFPGGKRVDADLGDRDLYQANVPGFPENVAVRANILRVGINYSFQPYVAPAAPMENAVVRLPAVPPETEIVKLPQS